MKKNIHHICISAIISLLFVVLACSSQNPKNQIEFDPNAKPLIISYQKDSFEVQREWTSFNGPDGLAVSAFIYYPVLSDSVELLSAIENTQWQARHHEAIKSKIGSSVANSAAKSMYYSSKNGNLINRKQPVFIFAPGLGWLPTDYSEIITRLVRKGIIVVAVTTSPISKEIMFPDGHFVSIDKAEADYNKMASCLSLVSDQVLKLSIDKNHPLFLKVDSEKIVVGGHSVSGASAILAASNNSNIKAIINLDGDVTDEIAKRSPHQSILYITSQPDDVEDLPIERWGEEHNEERRDKFFKQNIAQSSFAIRIKVPQIKHSDFLDVAQLKDSIEEKTRNKRFGKLAPENTYSLSTDAIVTFINSDFSNREIWNDFKKRNGVVYLENTNR